jgi:seryl-tRNA synthetase
MENFGNKRNEFAEKIKDYLSLIERSQKGEQNILAEIENGHAESALLRLRLVEKMLALTSVYLAINNISQTVLKKKDENALNNARKSLGKCLSYLESVVTKTVDAPFST